jgi:hypothetical protein
VIDVTCDQFAQIELFRGRPVLCERYSDLTDRLIEYRAVTRRSLEELRSDSVWARLTLLDEATRPAWVKTGRTIKQMMTTFRSGQITRKGASARVARSESTAADTA